MRVSAGGRFGEEAGGFWGGRVAGQGEDGEAGGVGVEEEEVIDEGAALEACGAGDEDGLGHGVWCEVV